MSGPSDTGTIDLSRDDTKDTERQVDASAYALAAVFGPVALPAGMPDYLKAAIMDRAEQDRDAAGDFLIDNRMNPDDAKTRQAKASAEDDDNLSQFAQIAQQERMEQEREAWSRTRSTVGNVTMTGAEWAQFAERLHNDDGLRQKLIETFEREGATREEAETRVDRVAQAADAAAVPPSQRTDEQKHILRDPQVDADLQTARTLEKSPETQPKSALSQQFDAASSPSFAAPTVTQKPLPAQSPAKVGLDF